MTYAVLLETRSFVCLAYRLLGFLITLYLVGRDGSAIVCFAVRLLGVAITLFFSCQYIPQSWNYTHW